MAFAEQTLLEEPDTQEDALDAVLLVFQQAEVLTKPPFPLRATHDNAAIFDGLNGGTLACEARVLETLTKILQQDMLRGTLPEPLKAQYFENIRVLHLLLG